MPTKWKSFRRNVVQHVHYFWIASRETTFSPHLYPTSLFQHTFLCSKCIAFMFKVTNVARENDFSPGIFFNPGDLEWSFLPDLQWEENQMKDCF